MRGTVTLQRLRIILAILIALSLTFAPITSAWAAMQTRASLDSTAVLATPVDVEAMSDCMKAMQAQQPAKGFDCPCCDSPTKAPCLDGGVCLAKCSVNVFAAFTLSADYSRPIIRHDRPGDPHIPPDWATSPPAPPPRA